jgi:ribosome-associated protein
VQKRVIRIKDIFITLGQLLKKEGIIHLGGEAKFFLETNEVYVNEVRETRRGKKLYSGDVVVIGKTSLTVSADVD